MLFVLGLFVGAFIGMAILGLCRCMALNNVQMPCSGIRRAEENQGDVAVNF